ncbi:hypothetical protein FB480_1011030 [Agrobacterium vitis]|nr:hypothetical protein FB480_1011030 [Agrobacterium vitis]
MKYKSVYLKRVGLISLALATSPLNAAEFDVSIFGHKMAISTLDTGKSLKIDGQELIKDEIININDILLVSGVPVVVGESSPGGNKCASTPFVISLPSTGEPHIDGPIENCRPVTMQASPNELHFSTTPLPNEVGQNWVWKPDTGFKSTSDSPFKTDNSKGWAQLKNSEISHPGDILSFDEIATQINDLLGPDKAAYIDIIMGTGSAQFDKDYLIGASFSRSTEEDALLIASIPNRKVFLAWKPEGKKIQVRPPIKEWPAKAKAELRNWSQ